MFPATFRNATLAAVAALSLAVLAPSEVAAQQRLQARISTIPPEGSANVVMWNRFRDLVRERSNGQIELQIFPGRS